MVHRLRPENARHILPVRRCVRRIVLASTNAMVAAKSRGPQSLIVHRSGQFSSDTATRASRRRDQMLVWSGPPDLRPALYRQQHSLADKTAVVPSKN